MRKISFTTLLMAMFFLSKAQDCHCGQMDNNIWNCQPQKLKNGASITRHYNCEETWLLFENKKLKIKDTLYSGPADPRIGFVDYTEYNNVLLFQNNVISGCCDPPEFLLYNKNTGKRQRNMGRLLPANLKAIYPYVAFLSNNQYEDKKAPLLQKIVITNLNNHKSQEVAIPATHIAYTLTAENILFAELLFDEIKLEHSMLKLSYQYKIKGQKNWHKKMINITIRNLK